MVCGNAREIKRCLICSLQYSDTLKTAASRFKLLFPNVHMDLMEILLFLLFQYKCIQKTTTTQMFGPNRDSTRDFEHRATAPWHHKVEIKLILHSVLPFNVCRLGQYLTWSDIHQSTTVVIRYNFRCNNAQIQQTNDTQINYHVVSWVYFMLIVHSGTPGDMLQQSAR